MDDFSLLDDLLMDSNFPKDYSVKVKLLEQDYLKLKDIASENDITLKKLVNKSIRRALDDIEKHGCYVRRGRVLVLEDTMILCSLKVKGKHYKMLKEICDYQDIRIKDVVRDILLFYPFEYLKGDY